MTGPDLDRRRFLATGARGSGLLALVAATGAGSGLLAACSGSDDPPDAGQPPVTRADTLEGDLAVAALLASLENLLLAVYQEALDRRDRLGPYPPSVEATITESLRHHKAHAVAWNSILTGAGKQAVTGVNLTVKSQVSDLGFNRARDATGVLTTFHDVESVTAITYLAAIGGLQNNAAIKVAASIHPVEHQHVGVLSYLLGRNLAAEAFGRVDGARTTTDSIG